MHFYYSLDVSNSENDAKITGIQQKGFQSSGAGCWSVSMQMLLQSRGVRNMSQTDIRSFRPNYNGKAIRELISPYKDLAPIEDDKKKKDKKQAELNEMARETFNIMESDKSSNALDRSEAFIKMAPGHMMEWAAEMKLSQDGTKLYGVPSQYLTIGQDGSVMVPSELSEDVNFQNRYQNMEGNYVGRKNGSESPDEEKNREDYLAKGGVNINEMIYLPKKVNLDILKNYGGERAKKRANEIKAEKQKKLGSRNNSKAQQPRVN